MRRLEDSFQSGDRNNSSVCNDRPKSIDKNEGGSYNPSMNWPQCIYQINEPRKRKAILNCIIRDGQDVNDINKGC
jgi:transposase